MSLLSYSDLQTSVAAWTHRADLTTIIPDLITIGENKIFREVRCKAMEATLSGTIANGVVALPADYLALKFARIASTPVSQLTGASASKIYAKYPLRASHGKPVLIGREGSNFIFGPYPDSTYTIAGIYYAKLTGIATSVNALFTESPELYLFAALSEAGDYVENDKKLLKWTAKYTSIVEMLNNESDAETGSGGGMQVSPE
jgi:hypothetical protein